MSASHLQPVPSPNERPDIHVDHILYQVNELLPEDQQVLAIPPDTIASDALRLMKLEGFSQLPVVQDGEIVGVFTHRSFADGVLELEGENKLHAEQLPVFDFLEQLSFASLTTDIDEILERLDVDNAVLVGSPENLVGIATPMDALRYLHRLAGAFLLLQEIERAIRILLRRAFSEDELTVAIERCSQARPTEGARSPSSIEDLSFGDYVQIVGQRDNWNSLREVFGTSRELVLAKLRPINNLRNDAFHFRRELGKNDYDRLVTTRGWLRLRLRVTRSKVGPS
jgi:CBS domain-containing protein